ncbi:MAG: AraC family transcriptional regulator [Spirochaetes bacterium]|nr:AraC family transcriptional regulator [Spirochaetota bacterium]
MQTSRGLSGSWIDPDHVFTFLAEGGADFILERRRWRLAAGDALIMPPRLRHVVLASPREPLTLYVAHFDLFPGAAPGRARLLREPPVVSLGASHREAVRSAFQRLHDAFHSGRPWRLLEAKGLMTQLIALLLDSEGGASPVSPQDTGWARIKPALDLLHTKFSQGDLPVAEAARAASLSASHFALLFRRQMGMPLHRYLRELRIRHARSLMADRGIPLAELAQCTGFADVYSFSKAFRKVTGVAPGKFRQLSGADGDSAQGTHGAPPPKNPTKPEDIKT